MTIPNHETAEILRALAANPDLERTAQNAARRSTEALRTYLTAQLSDDYGRRVLAHVNWLTIKRLLTQSAEKE